MSVGNLNTQNSIPQAPVQGAQLAQSQEKSIITALKFAAAAAARRYGAAGATGFLFGAAIGSQGVGPTNPAAVAVIAATAQALVNSGALTRDQKIAFQAAALLGVTAGNAFSTSRGPIANNDEAKNELAGALNMSVESVGEWLNRGQAAYENAESQGENTSLNPSTNNVALNSRQQNRNDTNQQQVQQQRGIGIA